ncbi:MAG: AmmeMemoRadiSam system protein B [Melioribacteraceae bacterium]|nr:AmmeMemoRadiSam system protein B [Melioribacteraceae bacterium]
MKVVREPAVAGMFYSSSKNKLLNDIEFLFKEVKLNETYENILGIVSPHAGYVYSGKTAAYAYSILKGKKINRVIIISPSHREYFPGISVYNGDAYKTPLGELEVDKEFVNKLIDGEKLIFVGMNGHRNEHALEVQLPFLQYVLNDFNIVPVVMGDQRKIFVDALAKKISDIIDDKTIIVASSDLSHFHSKEKATKLDSIVEEKIKKLDADGLMHSLENNLCEACGGGPIATLIKTAKQMNFDKVKILSRTDSGDVTGDSSEVVGYLSAVFYK